MEQNRTDIHFIDDDEALEYEEAQDKTKKKKKTKFLFS